MKQDYDTDLLVLLREQHSANNASHDGSSIQLNTHSLKRAFRAMAVARLYEVDPDAEDSFPQLENIIHEIGHLLGADHSKFNVLPGQHNNKGLASTFFHTTGCSTSHHHGMRTIMTYQDVCNQANNWRDIWPVGHCGPAGFCFPSRKFSAASQFDYVANQRVPIGNTQANNLSFIVSYAPTVAKYSDYIKQPHPPVPVIKVDQFPDYKPGDVLTIAKGDTLNFDAGDSYDPNGDSLNFRWSLYSGNRKIAAYKTQKVTHQFSKAGSFTMILSAHDGPGLYPPQELVDINVVKDKLTAPILELIQTLSKHKNAKLKWNRISDAKNYRIYRKVNDTSWQWHVSTSNIEYKINYSALDKGSTYHYKVYACADNTDQKCSHSSNIKSLLVK
ncbi:PKD domain-containing protein [Aliikangiella coralliicola]|uniref:PKD domain-containing protein n=1 Tax=Aliikangiella coralliicola TaxID=2592383 RepID=A0A545UCC6_9GAMM|nr:PKD domain-containing protein [Aliikangiella coralliicola]TQV87122.1 hypothetical protein FLL46_15060 [Aliikangiella coralliicola]